MPRSNARRARGHTRFSRIEEGPPVRQNLILRVTEPMIQPQEAEDLADTSGSKPSSMARSLKAESDPTQIPAVASKAAKPGRSACHRLWTLLPLQKLLTFPSCCRAQRLQAGGAMPAYLSSTATRPMPS